MLKRLTILLSISFIGLISIPSSSTATDKAALISTLLETAEYETIPKKLDNGDIFTTINCLVNTDFVAGFIQYTQFSSSKTAIINYLIVDDEYKNKKIGSTLLQLAVKNLCANGCTEITLEAVAKDGASSKDHTLRESYRTKLNKFYTTHGFELIRFDEYGDAIMRYKMPTFIENKTESKESKSKKEHSC